MSADPIIYCLEHVTDHRAFERLCSAVLASGEYAGIDPIGGTGDGGRDAVIRTDANGRRLVFAYTLRADWRTKLREDCENAKKHAPNVFVFVCTQRLNGSEKDWAHTFVEEYGWSLDLYDLERLRTQLAGPYQGIIARHPEIFVPPFFPSAGGQLLVNSKDTVLIDHVEADHALAVWLSRRLTLAGFRTWCAGTAPVAGENADECIHKLLSLRAARYLPILSNDSVDDSIFLERCAVASRIDGLPLPCTSLPTPSARLPSRLSLLTPANFRDSWSVGLAQVLAQLERLGHAARLDRTQGREIALRDYFPPPVTLTRPEPIIANAFRLRLPQLIIQFELHAPLHDEVLECLRRSWAFVNVSATRLLAFTPPPEELRPAVPISGKSDLLWSVIDARQGKAMSDIVKELTWRSLELNCLSKGLTYCPDRRVYYFPLREGRDWNQPFTHIDERQTRVQLTGIRTSGSGVRASKFRYQLAPIFVPRKDPEGSWTVLLRLYVRCTDLEGQPYKGMEIGRRRKTVTKGWWNKDWLARLLGVVQALETEQGYIRVGDGSRAVEMETRPLIWDCPIGLDLDALSRVPDFGEELAASRAWDGEDDETEIVADEEEEAE